jgi:L-lactate dehydrogenase complex protein LldG
MTHDDSTTSREKILKKIRKALLQKSPKELSDVDKASPVHVLSNDSLEVQFATNFSAISGKFVFCESENEFIENFRLIATSEKWDNIFCLDPKLAELVSLVNISVLDKEQDLLKTNVGITFCECLIARTGSVMMSSQQLSGRRLPVFANIHVVVAYSSQLLYDIKTGLKFIKAKYKNQLPSMLTTISGPSRTADIEKTLVEGAHGPKELFLFLIDDMAEE